jgi:hypothetical protein
MPFLVVEDGTVEGAFVFEVVKTKILGENAEMEGRVCRAALQS